MLRVHHVCRGVHNYTMTLVELAAYLSAIVALLFFVLIAARVVKRLVLGAGPLVLRLDPVQLKAVITAIKSKQ